MDRRLDPHLQRIVDNATGMNSNNLQERNFTYASVEQPSAGWGFGPGPRHPPQEHSSFNDFGRLFPADFMLYADDFSTSERVPFDAPDHSHPAPVTVSNRLSFAPRTIRNQPVQEPRTLSNSDNHFRFTQNLREGIPMNPALPRSNKMQQTGPAAPQRNGLFAQQQNNSQPLDSIDQLANAILMQKSIPPVQAESAVDNFFHDCQPSGLNQLQPQKQQVTPPFNLCKS
jgi:ATP-dependent DNA helicase HFM1/MER3